MAGRRPDFDVLVSERVAKDSGKKRFYARVGSAWKSDRGDMINIQLSPGVALVGGRDIDIALFPPRDRDGGSQRAGGSPAGDAGAWGDGAPVDDDLPF
jgi:hypothetical protein